MEGDVGTSHKPGAKQILSLGSSSEDQAHAAKIGTDLVQEPNPTSIHFFVDIEPCDRESYREAIDVDHPNRDLDSITTFLTLPTNTARIESKKKYPVINFSKSLILTSEQYITVVQEMKNSKEEAAKQRQNQRTEREECRKCKAVEKEEAQARRVVE